LRGELNSLLGRRFFTGALQGVEAQLLVKPQKSNFSKNDEGMISLKELRLKEKSFLSSFLEPLSSILFFSL